MLPYAHSLSHRTHNLFIIRTCLRRRDESVESDRSLIQRADSSLMAMRALLDSSQEESSPHKEQPRSHVSDTATPGIGYNTEVSTAEDKPLGSSQATSHVSETSSPGDTASTISGRESPNTPSSEMPTPTLSPQNSASQTSTEASQAISDDEQDNGDSIPHEEHAAEVISHAIERISLRTRRPRLWRHAFKIYDSMCAYNGSLS